MLNLFKLLSLHLWQVLQERQDVQGFCETESCCDYDFVISGLCPSYPANVKVSKKHKKLKAINCNSFFAFLEISSVNWINVALVLLLVQHMWKRVSWRRLWFQSSRACLLPSWTLWERYSFWMFQFEFVFMRLVQLLNFALSNFALNKSGISVIEQVYKVPLQTWLWK